MRLGFSWESNSNNMNKKLVYEAPGAELILVRFEENILSGVQSVSGVQDYSNGFGEEQNWDD